MPTGRAGIRLQCNESKLNPRLLNKLFFVKFFSDHSIERPSIQGFAMSLQNLLTLSEWRFHFLEVERRQFPILVQVTNNIYGML